MKRNALLTLTGLLAIVVLVVFPGCSDAVMDAAHAVPDQPPVSSLETVDADDDDVILVVIAPTEDPILVAQRIFERYGLFERYSFSNDDPRQIYFHLRPDPGSDRDMTHLLGALEADPDVAGIHAIDFGQSPDALHP